MTDSIDIANCTYSTVARDRTSLEYELVCTAVHECGYIPEKNLPDRLRVIMPVSGTGFIEIDEKTYTWVAPCLICLNEHHVCVSAEIPGQVRVLYFHPCFLNAKLNFSNIIEAGNDVEPAVKENRLLFRAFITKKESRLVCDISPENAQRALSLFNSLKDEIEGQPTGWWRCKSRSYLAEFLFLVARMHDTSEERIESLSFASREPGLTVSASFRQILDYVMRSYQKKISLDGYARAFGTNRTSLNELFKKETGKTAIAYLIDLRLRIAIALLLDTALPVAEVAERVGMSDVSHFERMFRKKYLTSPKDYRLAAKGVKN